MLLKLAVLTEIVSLFKLLLGAFTLRKTSDLFALVFGTLLVKYFLNFTNSYMKFRIKNPSYTHRNVNFINVKV